MARLIEKHGGNPRCAPALREVPASWRDATLGIVDDLINARHGVVIFMTGVAASLLFRSGRAGGHRQQLVQALQHITTVARGPKPSAALRGFGVPPKLSVREPFARRPSLARFSSATCWRWRAKSFWNRRCWKRCNETWVIGAIGPTSHAILQVHGVPVHLVPEQPRMGPLVRSLMLYLDRSAQHRAKSAPLSAHRELN